MSMKTTKYKLSDMAKDLKVTNNDLIECLGKLGGEPKKTQSVLTPEEISYVLEYYTQNNQVDSFDAFYANNVKPAKEEKKADKKPVKAEKKEKKAEKKLEPKPAPKAEAKPEPKAEPKVEKKPEPKAEVKKPEVRPEPKKQESKKPETKPVEKAPEQKPVAAGTCDDENARRIREFLEGLLQHMNSPAQVNVALEEKGRYQVTLEGEKLGQLIGRRGETLDAIQQLTNYAVNRGRTHRVRIHINAEHYRAKREESLVRLAQKVAGKVVKYRRNVTLEPMNAYERHVIHTALQETPDITTYSIGTEPNRRTVVAYSRGEHR